MLFIQYMSTISSHWYYYNRQWKLFRASLIMLKHQDNLDGLILWAQRKRLKGVDSHYWRLLQGVHSFLERIEYESPILLEFARWIYCANEMLFPTKYRKGFASQYKRRRI